MIGWNNTKYPHPKKSIWNSEAAANWAVGILMLPVGFFVFCWLTGSGKPTTERTERSPSDNPISALLRQSGAIQTMPLINLIRRHNVNAMQTMLSRNPKLANAESSETPEFDRPLIEAAIYHDPDSIELLLQYGAAVNSTSDTISPLHVVLLERPEGRTESPEDINRCVQLLIKHGANVNALARGGTPLDYAMQRKGARNLPEVEQLIKTHGGTNHLNKFRAK